MFVSAIAKEPISRNLDAWSKTQIFKTSVTSVCRSIMLYPACVWNVPKYLASSKWKCMSKKSFVNVYSIYKLYGKYHVCSKWLLEMLGNTI